MSVVVRLPDDVWGTAKIIAGTQGKKPAEMLREAWEQYVATLDSDKREGA
jgi:hypothetical protein